MGRTTREWSDNPPQPLVDVAGLAERLGVSERFVRRLVSERRVPFHKIGKFVRFDAVEIDVWIAERRVDVELLAARREDLS